MVDLLWFVLTLILLAAETVVLVSLLVLRRETPRTDTRETRTEYLQPNYNEVAGFRLAAYPDNEIIIPQRCWLIESEVGEVDFVIVPGRAMSLRSPEAAPCGNRPT